MIDAVQGAAAERRARTHDVAALARLDAETGADVRAVSDASAPLSMAVRRSFGEGVTRIYGLGVFFMLGSLVLLALWMPELPLAAHHPVIEEPPPATL